MSDTGLALVPVSKSPRKHAVLSHIFDWFVLIVSGQVKHLLFLPFEDIKANMWQIYMYGPLKVPSGLKYFNMFMDL